MNVILLSGGSGKRLWPLSNDIRSKQFIPILRSETGLYESMICRVYRQITTVDPDAQVLIATGERQVSTIMHQLGERVSICVEPYRRDTFPAIALASSFLACQEHVPLDEPVVVCPVDPYVEMDYYHAVRRLFELAGSGNANLSLMGVEPTIPSGKYGYIIPEDGAKVSAVRAFKEKPTREAAEEYIRNGALWNCGVFAFRLHYLLGIAKSVFGTAEYSELKANYENLPRISFDYAVVEKEKNISVMRFSGQWVDVGTWNTLTDVIREPSIGHVAMDGDCENTSVVNMQEIPILCMGLKNLIVVASCDGILVSEREHSAAIKPFVERIEGQAHYAEESWGSFSVLETNDEAITVKLIVHAGKELTSRIPGDRTRMWTIVSGSGTVMVDGIARRIRAGDVVQLPAQCGHALRAETRMQIIEVQVGFVPNAPDSTQASFPGTPQRCKSSGF